MYVQGIFDKWLHTCDHKKTFLVIAKEILGSQVGLDTINPALMAPCKEVLYDTEIVHI